MARLDTDWNAAQSRRRSRRARIRATIIIFIAYAVIAGTLYVVFRTPLLHVRAVTVQGAVYTDPSAVRTAVMSQRPGLIGRMAGWGSLLAWPSTLSSSTRTLLPGIQQIRIHKSYFRRTVTVQITERQPLGVWCFSQQDPPSCFWFDANGIAYAPALYTEGSLIPVVHDTAQSQVGDNHLVLPGDLLQNFLAVLSLIRDQRIPLKRVELADLGKQEVAVPAYGGPTLYFSLRFPPLTAVPVINDLRTKGIYNGLQRVDLRSQNRAFYQ